MSQRFPTDTSNLAPAQPSTVVDLSDGDVFELRIAPVAKQLGEHTVRMLGYNGSIPGPTLRVREGSEITVNVVNEGDLEATVHWHGLRLENASDGTHETQAPIPIGGSYSCRVQFPDPGAYWYHPHIREDYAPGHGPVRERPRRAGRRDYWPPAHRELAGHARRRAAGGRADRAVRRRDDARGHGPVRQRPARRRRAASASAGPARRGHPLLPHEHGQHPGLQRWRARRTHEARGRRQRARRARAARRERRAGAVRAGHRRRAVRHPGKPVLEHRTPQHTYTLATVEVSGEVAQPPLREAFETLRHNRRVERRAARAATRGSRPSPTRRSRSWPRWTWAGQPRARP